MAWVDTLQRRERVIVFPDMLATPAVAAPPAVLQGAGASEGTAPERATLQSTGTELEACRKPNDTSRELKTASDTVGARLAAMSEDDIKRVKAVIASPKVTELQALLNKGVPVFEWIDKNLHTWNQENFGSLLYHQLVAPMRNQAPPFCWWAPFQMKARVETWMTRAAAAPAVVGSLAHALRCGDHERREGVMATVVFGGAASALVSWGASLAFGWMGLAAGPPLLAAIFITSIVQGDRVID